MGKHCKRMSFSRIDEVLDMPNLIEVQKNSYRKFLQEDLREVLADVSPIVDYSGNLILEFVDYSLDSQPKNTIERCRERDLTYAAPLKVFVRLKNKETGEIKETEVFMGDFPLMTEHGTFVINGAERVIVSQLVRSPGAYFSMTVDKAGKKLFASQIIPNRGAWLEYETDSNDGLWVRIDRARKLPITVLLRALGYGSNSDITGLLGEDERLMATLANSDSTTSQAQGLIEIYKRQKPGEPPTEDGARTLLNNLFFDPKRYDLMRVGRYKFNKKLGIAARIGGQVAAQDVIDPRSGEVLVKAGETIRRDQALDIQNTGINVVHLQCEDHVVRVLGNNFVDARGFLPFDPKEAGINEFAHLPTLMATIEGLTDPEEIKRAVRENVHNIVPKHIIVDDITASVSYLLGLPYGVGVTDDIDHLGNRRLRSVGELLQNQVRIGLTRLERVVRERMAIQDANDVKPNDLINIRPVSAAIKEFFGSSQLTGQIGRAHV